MDPIPTSSPARQPRRNEESGRALIVAWQASGLSATAYARRSGIPAQRIGYWRLRLERDAVPAPSGGAFVEIAAAPRPFTGLVLEINDSCRVRVEPGFDVETLRSVIAALSTAAVSRC